MAISKLVLNGTEYEIGGSSSSNSVTDIARYDGVELDSYEWADFQTMCDNGDFEDIQVGDYKTIELTTGETVVMQIAGIDTYAQYDSSVIRKHIDWISRDCLEGTIRWSTGTYNNGDSTNVCPYLVSNIYTYLNEDILPTLPEEVQNVITDKYLTLENRYSSSNTLASSTGTTSWVDIGTLWIPSEYEIFGSVIYGTPGYSNSGAVQYPLFANSTYHRTKAEGLESSGPVTWWTLNPQDGSEGASVIVNQYGFPAIYGSSMSYGAIPLCFRIAA